MTLLTQFRDRYSAGSLSTDLVCVNEGQYVVRAQLLDGDVVLSAGMSASADVQSAEDGAIERALLRLFPTQVEASAQTPISPASTPALATSSLNAVQNGRDEEEATNVSSTSQIEPAIAAQTQPSADRQSDNRQSDNQQSDSLPQAELPQTSEPSSSVESESAPDDESDNSRPIDAIPEEPMPLDTAQFDEADATVVDLSNIIAQTDVELKRLGWTNQQGREYLQKAYGKRSRQQLSDEELMHFLLYLEEQPSS